MSTGASDNITFFIGDAPKRITGFMPLARNIVLKFPGLKAQEVYQMVMAEHPGEVLSASANPEGSLVATLHKHHRQYGLERRRDSTGRYRYYPRGTSQAIPALPEEEEFFMEEGEGLLGQTLIKKADQVGAKPQGTSQAPRPPAVAATSTNGNCCLSLSPQDMKKMRALVDLGRYRDEHEACRDLIKKGLEAVLAKISA